MNSGLIWTTNLEKTQQNDVIIYFSTYNKDDSTHSLKQSNLGTTQKFHRRRSVNYKKL